MPPRRTLRTLLLVLAVAVASALLAGQAREFAPVTDAMLQNPPPADWLTWRGSAKTWGYSPLRQITRDNVAQLQLAWSWTMQPGSQHSAPIVHDGVMYLPNPGGVIQALDAATGDLLWEFPPELPAKPDPRLVRGISVYGDRLFLNTTDGRLMAIDARTGKLVWQTEVGKPADGMYYNAGSVIARGKVISGLQGCQKFVEEKCAITAHDARTGKELWRTITMPKPQDPESESWGDIPYLYRAGISTWITGSYDPELNLTYWSTSQAKPFARAARGTDRDVLYSNTLLALDADTGRIVWYRQLIPGDTHDMDEVFENILVDTPEAKSVFKVGKIGILWQLDRRTGKMIRATDLGYQNLVDVDPVTGKVTHRPDKIPKLDVPLVDQCPGEFGFRNIPSMSYSPDTQAFYLPMLLQCGTHTYHAVEKVPGGGGNGRGQKQEYLHPKANRNLGALTAISTTGKVLWQQSQRALFTAATLTTAGGLVFVGDINRYFRAYDAKTGKVLWETRAPTSPQGFPLSYSVNGRQYIAVPVGTGLGIAGLRDAITPDVRAPRPGNALLVFALPKSASVTNP
jgi:alcohol dehydrogenase (cytochrome c)